jgi:hypothetical protein
VRWKNRKRQRKKKKEEHRINSKEFMIACFGRRPTRSKSKDIPLLCAHEKQQIRRRARHGFTLLATALH